MKALLRNITLMKYATDEDNGRIPWFAWPLAALFIVGWLAAQIILSDSGF